MQVWVGITRSMYTGSGTVCGTKSRALPQTPLCYSMPLPMWLRYWLSDEYDHLHLSCRMSGQMHATLPIGASKPQVHHGACMGLDARCLGLSTLCETLQRGRVTNCLVF